MELNKYPASNLFPDPTLKNAFNDYCDYIVLLLTWTLFILPSPVFAEENRPAEVENLHIMPKVTVTADPIEKISGVVTIDRDTIESLPAGNGNINDLLETIPGVQFSEEYRNSYEAGEIKPPEIAISGGRPGENSYILDGVSFNSAFDPNVTNKALTTDLPGHSQRFFIPAHLIDSLTIYRSNIPARYGGFGGGVQILTTADPDPIFSGELGYQTTRDSWTNFYIDPNVQEDFYNTVDSNYQPKFSKHNIHSILNIPITPNSGLLLFTSRKESSIPISLFAQKETQLRRNDAFNLKYVSEPNSDLKYTISAFYNPYKEKLFLKNTTASNYELIGGGYKISSKIEKTTSNGNIEFNIAWQKSGDSRTAPQNYFNWNTTPIKDAGAVVGKSRSPEGGYGDIKKVQNSLNLNLHHQFFPIQTKRFNHKISVGGEIEYTAASFERLEESTYYAVSKTENIDCNDNTIDCIDGDQYFWYKYSYPKYEATADVTNFSTYAEDTVRYKRAVLKPGARVSYSNFQKNLDIAPRLTTSYDLFNNGRTILTGGANRYYSTELIAHKIRENTPELIAECRDNPDLIANPTYATKCQYASISIDNPWRTLAPRSIDITRVSDLNTPYSDELSAGLKQQLFGGVLDLLYIDRKYKDGIVTLTTEDPDGIHSYWEFTNQGSRDHQEFSITWERSWKNHFIMLDGTWAKTKSNSMHYDDIYDPEQESLVYSVDYEKLVNLATLSQNNYNRPFIGKIIYAIKLPYNMTFTNETIYRNRHRSLKQISGTYTAPDGVKYDKYEVYRTKNSVIFDWRFTWETPHYKGNRLIFSLDIENVFDRKVTIGNTIDEYLLGRQFWAGLTYKF